MKKTYPLPVNNDQLHAMNAWIEQHCLTGDLNTDLDRIGFIITHLREGRAVYVRNRQIFITRSRKLIR